MSPFTQKVVDVVKLIPPGKVASYGQIAAYIGAPRAARQVGWILRQVGPEIDIPWWRVINHKGRISIDGNLHADRDLQKKLLEAEGIKVKDYQVDIGKYKFIIDKKLLEKFQISDKYSQEINTKYNL